MEEAPDTNMGCMISSNTTNEVTNNNRNECSVNAGSLANTSEPLSNGILANTNRPANTSGQPANDLADNSDPVNSSEPVDTGEDQTQTQPHPNADGITETAMEVVAADGSGADAVTQPEVDTNKSEDQGPVCTFCFSVLEPCDIVKPHCEHSYCSNCIKSMFLKACKDESSMPPRCCTAIPLGIALPFLTKDEATLFREKFEEWHTTDRIYCPVPTCSAFIPNRLLITPPASPKQVDLGSAEMTEQLQTDNTSVGSQCEEGAPATLGTDAAETLGPEAVQASGSNDLHTSAVSCPKCEATICVRCRRLSHPHTPCEGEDHSVTAFLNKFKLKRCPKCRNAVKKMFGCDHIRCRCGAQWCWACCKRIDVCESEGCYGEDIDQRKDADDDLDAGTWHQGDFQNIGDEPDRNIPDPFNCDHYWERVRWTTGSPEWHGLECHRCTRELRADPRAAAPPAAAVPADTDTVMTDAADTDTASGAETNDQQNSQQPTHKDTVGVIEVDEGSIAWRCYCSLFVCRSCMRPNELSNIQGT
jgi:IBR domain, a half RING-finger domain